MNSDSFETTRIVVILLVISLRLGLIRKYLQAYLNIAPQKLTFMKKETGRITNIELQKLVNVFGIDSNFVLITIQLIYRSLESIITYV